MQSLLNSTNNHIRRYSTIGRNLRNFDKRSSMNFTSLSNIAEGILKEIEDAGTFKKERVITSPQAREIQVGDKRMINFCANNYLHLSNHPELIKASKEALDSRGFGMSSVRFICGTQDLHKKLEKKISEFHQTDETILYSSCFDANGGFFETILSEKDAIISDTLNHASIIDGIRLSKAQRLRYNHLDMNDLEENLKKTQNCRARLIVTDGVFSMDGDLAPLDKIVALAQKYNAGIFVDECHGTGVIGKTGRGTPELFGVEKHIDVITSTLGKALGGGSGGYTTGRKPIIDLMRQRSRPYLFSNSILPAIAAASIRALDLIMSDSESSNRINALTKYFRGKISEAGFKITGNINCPIVPIIIGDEKIATEFGNEMADRGIFVVGFSYPVVPKGKARIRCQISTGHSFEDLDHAIRIFTELGRRKGIIG